jgi:hypothetical protein
LQDLADELDVNFPTLFGKIIYEGSGRVLNSMHAVGVIHGPRQSHYMNYTVPTKDYRGVKVCDFESFMLVKDLTEIQALKHMAEDLACIISSAADMYLVVLESLVKVSKTGNRPKGCNLPSLADVIRYIEPAELIIRGYTNGEIGLEDVKKYGSDIAFRVVEGTKRQQLANSLKYWSELKDAVANKIRDMKRSS